MSSLNDIPEVRELLKGFPVIVTQDVVWGEMDAYHHVNNVVYFRYFENARIAYMNRLGWSDWSPEQGIGPIVSEVRAKFRRPLTFPDTISIGAGLGTMSEDRFVLKHIVVSHSQKVITTEGEGTVVTFDYQAKRKTPIPDDIREKMRKLQQSA